MVVASKYEKSLQAEHTDNSDFSVYEGTQFAPISGRSETAVVASVAPMPENTLLDSFITAIKWIFLYIPGAAAIHLIAMGLALLFFYKDWSGELMVGPFGAAVVSTFMIMLGVGKLSDLKYLRVVGSIMATSALLAMLYSILIVFIPGDFFGLFPRLTLPLTLLIGYLVKRDTDKKVLAFDNQVNN